MKKLVALIGDYYHKEEWAREALEQSLKAEIENNEVQLTYIRHEQLAEELDKKPDGVILFMEDRLNPADEHVKVWMNTDIASKITAYVRDGGSWLAWHSGLACYDAKGDYIQMLRGRFQTHPRDHQQVTYTVVEHREGMVEPYDFTILDEHYFVQCDEANTDVFLRSSSVDGESIAGWAHSYGQGRVCCLTPAHNREGMLHSGSLNILNRSIHWCAL